MSAARGPRTGVLVMAHGTPDTPDQIEAFYTRIRRGRPPTPELLAELTARYEAIGGTSPLTARTRAQVDGLAAALEAAEPGRFTVRLGTKYVHPTIEEAVAGLAADGVDRVVGLVLTPHRSTMGSGQYAERAEAAAHGLPPLAVTVVPSWHRAPAFPPILAGRLRAVLGALDPSARRRTGVLFTAHSLPQRAVAEGDPYPEQVAESAADIAGLLDLDADPSVTWGTAWQSAGRTPEPWIGPDLLLEIDRVAAEGATAVVVCPVGFVSDHLEVLYDLDIEARGRADSLGIAFARTPSLDDDPAFLAMLADVVRDAADGGS
ncbi:MAG: ferrochelatase [Acidimicrobiales bacterium]